MVMSQNINIHTCQYDDFDCNSNDDNWDDDLNIMDDTDRILELSRQNSVEREDYACWQCMKCYNINNVKLTIEKENMKCCGCNNSCYIPDETDTFQSNKWHSYNDYLLRVKASISNNQMYLNNIASNVKINKIFEWICTNCNAKSTQEKECSVCGCNKTSKFNYNSPSELVTSGYIRQFTNNNSLNIPIIIDKLCECFYTNYDHFKNQICREVKYVFKTPLKKFLCKKFVSNNLFGEQMINGTKNYLWRIKLTINKNELEINKNKNESEINKNKNEKKENIKLWGVSIGMISDPICSLVNDPDGIFEQKMLVPVSISGNMFKSENVDTYGIFGNGSYGKYKQYCRGFIENDIVTLKYNGSENTIGYGINDDWYGIAYYDIKKCNLKLGVHVEQQGVQIECVEFFEC